MSQADDDLEIIGSENGEATSDEWVKESAPASTNDGKIARQLKKGCPRIEKWINLLGVKNKPDPMADWDNIYNLKNQTSLRKDCRELVKKMGESAGWSVPEIESMLTLYCKRRNVEYEQDKGWIEILEKLLNLPFDTRGLFNVFWAITTKYIPRTSKVYDLFRLLLIYHDPPLSAYLESFKIHPSDFAEEWFRTLLGKNMGNELCFDLWDRYFEKGDPFLIFFIAIAFVQSVKDELLQLRDRMDIIDLLRSVPGKMSLDDISDLLEVCYVHLNLTPISVREDFHCMLFGSNLLDDYSELPLNRLICLPVSAQELYRRAIDLRPTMSANFSYFIIDTRPQKSFNAGSIPGSYNLNAETIVEDPKKFGYAMNTLMEFKGANCAKDHICFLGSGREEEDQFMMLMIAKFLHQSYEHISYADGGYRALHNILSETGNLQKLSNHFKRNECSECKRGGPAAKSDGKRGGMMSIFERLRKSIPMQTTVKPQSSEQKSGPSKTKAEETVKHVRSSDKGRRYRNVQSMFSINEDSLSSEVDDLNMAEIGPSVKVREKLKWAEITRKAEIGEHFEGEEVMSPGNEHVPCYLALSRTHMHIFHKVPNESNFVYPSMREPLASIMRVTSKRHFPEYLTFKFGYELPTGESHISRVHYFILTKAGECAKAVKLAILALKPLAMDEKDDELSDV